MTSDAIRKEPDTLVPEELSYFETHGSGEWEEIDVTFSYSLFPELQIGLGFKRIILDFEFTTIRHKLNEPRKIESYTSHEEQKIYGPTLNIGGQICLANLIGINLSMFSVFSYGVLKTDWGRNQTDSTRYHSTNLGLSWELPRLAKQVKSELRFGYRAQAIYTEAFMGDAADNSEGFPLGLRLVF